MKFENEFRLVIENGSANYVDEGVNGVLQGLHLRVVVHMKVSGTRDVGMVVVNMSQSMILYMRASSLLMIVTEGVN